MASWGLESEDGSIGTGVQGREHGDRRMGWESRDGTVGASEQMVVWGR